MCHFLQQPRFIPLPATTDTSVTYKGAAMFCVTVDRRVVNYQPSATACWLSSVWSTLSKSFVDNTINLSWHNFLRAAFKTKVPEGSNPIFKGHQISLTQCRIVGKKPSCQIQLYSSSRFDTIPECDRHRQTVKASASTALVQHCVGKRETANSDWAADTYVTVTMFLGLYESWSRKMTFSTKWSMWGSSFGPRTYNIHLWVDRSSTSFLLPTKYLTVNHTSY